MTTPQNICFFNTTKFWGGGEKWHFEAAEMMSIATQNKTFFVCDKAGELAKKLDGKDILQFHITVNNISFLNPSKINRLVNFYQKNNIDVVIFNSPKDLKLGGRAAKKAGIKTIVYRRGIAVEVKKKRLNEELFKNIVTHFIFNSNATKGLLEKHYKEVIKTKKTAIIYNAIEFGTEETSSQKTLQKETLIIGNAGRLVEQKAQHYLLDIAKQLKYKNLQFKIQIAGDGPLYDKLKKKIKTENLIEQVELLGFMGDMKLFMNNLDIFVSTAIWEGFGFVLAEAMSTKKPVLAFDLSSNPELVKDGENGFLIPKGSVDIFVQKLELLIKDKALRNKMGNTAFNFAKTNFEKQQQFQKLIDFIS